MRSLDAGAQSERAPQGGKVWGEIIEDRGSQVTLSALGQHAPLDEKEHWDPDFAKRKKLKATLDTLIPEFSVRIGGADVGRCHQARHRQRVRRQETARRPGDPPGER